MIRQFRLVAHHGVAATWLILACCLVWGLAGCGSSSSEGPDGTLTVRFAFSQVEGIKPSYQTALWLEDSTGTFITTLYVSDYLAYGGFNDPKICPHWPGRKTWNESSPEFFELVTGATPALGPNEFAFDCEERGISLGRIRVYLEVHLVADQNVLYMAEVPVGKEPTTAQGSPVEETQDLAARYPVVRDFVVRYQPKTD